MEAGLTELLLRFLYRCVIPNAENVGGSMQLRYGRPFKVFAALALIALLAVFVAMVRHPPNAKDLPIVLTVSVTFAVLIGSLALEFFGVSILYDESGIKTFSPWRASRSVTWSEILGASYSEICQWYVIQTVKQGRIRCHLFLNGTASLLEELRSRGIEAPQWRLPLGL